MTNCLLSTSTAYSMHQSTAFSCTWLHQDTAQCPCQHVQQPCLGINSTVFQEDKERESLRTGKPHSGSKSTWKDCSAFLTSSGSLALGPSAWSAFTSWGSRSEAT